MQKMEFFLFVTVFVILNTQGTARPLDATNGIKLTIPTTMEKGHSIILNGVLNNLSKSITVMLVAEGADSGEIHYDYEKQRMQVTPGVEGYHEANIDIADKSSTFTLGITLGFDKFGCAELNVTFNVNGLDLDGPLHINAKSLKNMHSIILKDGIKTIDNLVFNFPKST